MVFMDVMVTPDECQTSCFIWGHPHLSLPPIQEAMIYLFWDHLETPIDESMGKI